MKWKSAWQAAWQVWVCVLAGWRGWELGLLGNIERREGENIGKGKERRSKPSKWRKAGQLGVRKWVRILNKERPLQESVSRAGWPSTWPLPGWVEESALFTDLRVCGSLECGDGAMSHVGWKRERVPGSAPWEHGAPQGSVAFFREVEGNSEWGFKTFCSGS